MKKFGRKLGFPVRKMFEQAPAKRAAGDVADGILEFLSDGKVHDPKEIANAVGLFEEEVEKVLDFLMRMGLVKKGIRIDNLGSDFLKLPVGEWKPKHQL